MPETPDVIQEVDTPADPVVSESPAPFDWHTEIHPDVKADKVWDSVTDLKSLTKGYADAVKYNVGALKLPAADAAPEEWAKVWDKLGRPAAPEGYKEVDNDQGDPEFLQHMRGVAHAAGLNPQQWKTLVDANSRFVQARADSTTEQMNTATATLEAEWGGAYDRKIGLTQRAVQSYTDDATMMEKIAKSGLGNDVAFIKMLNKFAEDLASEGLLSDQFDSVTDKASAQADIERLTTSEEYKNPRHPNHLSTVEKVTKLFELVYN